MLQVTRPRLIFCTLKFLSIFREFPRGFPGWPSCFPIVVFTTPSPCKNFKQNKKIFLPTVPILKIHVTGNTYIFLLALFYSNLHTVLKYRFQWRSVLMFWYGYGLLRIPPPTHTHLIATQIMCIIYSPLIACSWFTGGQYRNKRVLGPWIVHQSTGTLDGVQTSCG